MLMPSHSKHFDYERLTIVIGTELYIPEARLELCRRLHDLQRRQRAGLAKRGPQVAPGKNWEYSGMLGPG